MEQKVLVKKVEIATYPKYKAATVFFVDDKGVDRDKKVMSFGGTEQAFLSLASNKEGNYTITVEKVGEFWNWTAAKYEGKASVAIPSTTKTTGGNWETPEEREKKQRYIIRQSSISNAISYYSGADVSVANVLETAREFEDFVYGEASVKKEVETSDNPMSDLEDDIPF